MSTTTEIAITVDSYIAAWNETDPGARRRLIDIAVSEDATYVDPMLTGDGQDGIDAMLAAAQQQMPDHRLQRVGPIDAYQDRVRFSWDVTGPDGGDPVLAGTDYAVIAPDGRLRSVTGFFDLAPGR